MAPSAPSTNQNLLGGREFPVVTWYKDPGLRKLYLLLSTVILVSATNGFDGSMMNGLQTVENWKNCKIALKLSPGFCTDQGIQTSNLATPSVVSSTPFSPLVPCVPFLSLPGSRIGAVVALPSLLVS